MGKATWSPKSVDYKLAIEIRSRRMEMNMEVAEMASAIGVSEIELQKFERAELPVPLGRLALIANCLNAHPYDFFNPDKLNPLSVFNPHVLELSRLYNSIKNPQLKQQLLDKARMLTIEDGK
jgi:transcriptional regulator with XRE-family HTH domain